MQMNKPSCLFAGTPPLLLLLLATAPWFPTHRLLTSFAAWSSLPHRELLTDSLLNLAFLTLPLDLLLEMLLLWVYLWWRASSWALLPLRLVVEMVGLEVVTGGS